MPAKTQHVVPANGGGWNVKAGGSSKATKHHDTKAAAEAHATQIAKNQGAELVIHGKDGKIQNKNSFGNDPCPPKDKK